ncbi:uncharacterized protein [Lolium perenne]|uniref:uncharacterized protein isoform X3 n=1 Tax=Lolium perenne TaxID=4522 RepID=UPI003A9980A6
MDLRCRTSFQRRHMFADEGRYRHTAGTRKNLAARRRITTCTYWSPEPGVFLPVVATLFALSLLADRISDPHPSGSGVLRNRITYGNWIEIQFYADGLGALNLNKWAATEERSMPINSGAIFSPYHTTLDLVRLMPHENTAQRRRRICFGSSILLEELRMLRRLPGN